ncbi:MAG: hypothetical protein GY759_24325 [Chloroflexi bacterium]|nr:hypothetical protein [Chloroflexota bacterium]
MLGRILLVGLLFFIAACRADTGIIADPSNSTEPMPTATLVAVSAEEAIKQVLRAESKGVVEEDIELLASLWVEEAMVRDAHHTPDDESDDAVWQGIDAVLDRYVVRVFPGNAQFAEPGEMLVTIEGDRAEVRSTTQIGQEISPAGDLWILARRDGGWRLLSLTYNLEKNP